MRIIRGRSVMAVDLIKDYILPDPDFSETSVAESIKELLRNQPENTFVLQAWQEYPEQEPDLLAFIIAYAAPNVNHVFVIQAWANPGLQDTKVQDRCFLHLQVWAESIGRSKIRAETTRNPEAFLRKWNFVPFSTILEFDITQYNIDHNQVVMKEKTQSSPESKEFDYGTNEQNLNAVESISGTVSDISRVESMVEPGDNSTNGPFDVLGTGEDTVRKTEHGVESSPHKEFLQELDSSAAAENVRPRNSTKA